MVKLNSSSVYDKMQYVVYSSLDPTNGIPADAVLVSGVFVDFVFHWGRLDSIRAEVAGLLDELPEAFHRRNGFGAPMLDGTNDSITDRQLDCLLALGTGLGMVTLSSIEIPSQYIRVCVDTDPTVENPSIVH